MERINSIVDVSWIGDEGLDQLANDRPVLDSGAGVRKWVNCIMPLQGWGKRQK